MEFENKIEKKPNAVELTSEDGLVIWREVFEDGSQGSWERSGISTDNKNGLLQLKKELQEKYGTVN